MSFFVGGEGVLLAGAKGVKYAHNLKSRTPVKSPDGKTSTPHENVNVANGEMDFYQSGQDGSFYWPENLGFVSEPKANILDSGTLLDRYGDNDGAFLSPIGTPFLQRGLGPGDGERVYSQYEVIKALPVKEGEVAPAFGTKGGGIQILPNFPQIVDINWLIDNGYLKEIN